MDWNDQRAFLAVMEGGSLSEAGRRLGVAQPTVRHRIEELERTLGTALFTRSVNGLVPTEQARALAGHVRAMALASEAFVRAASAPPGAVAGTVRISVSEFVGVEVLPPMLASLRARHPNLGLEIALSNEAADMLGQEADIAIRMHRPKQGALVARQVGRIPLCLFAHRDYVARRGMPATPQELVNHDLIGSDRTRADLALMAGIAPFLARQDFVVRTDSHPAQLAAVRAGLGIGVVQRPIGRADAALLPVLPDLEVHHMESWVVAHEDLRQVPRVRAAFDHLVATFTDYCRGETA